MLYLHIESLKIKSNGTYEALTDSNSVIKIIRPMDYILNDTDRRVISLFNPKRLFMFGVELCPHTLKHIYLSNN